MAKHAMLIGAKRSADGANDTIKKGDITMNDKPNWQLSETEVDMLHQHATQQDHVVTLILLFFSAGIALGGLVALVNCALPVTH